MWRMRVLSWLSLVLVVSLAFVPADAAPDPAARLASSSNVFGFDLYQRLRSKPGNLVISPASLTTALTMAWGGAKGETAEQMRRVLHLVGSPGEVMIASGELARSLQDPGRPVVFHIANRLFTQSSYKLVPAFQQKTAKAFGAPVEPLDFRKAPEPARARINQWIEEKTARRIQDLVPRGGVGPDTRLVIVNAIYFLGDWENPFLRDLTRPAPFHLSASETRNVPTMNQSNTYFVGHQGAVTALQIPYKGSAMSMLFLVPDAIDGLPAVEGALGAKALDSLVSAMKPRYLELALPKFEVNPGGSLSLGEDLRALGMTAAFDSKRADFTGIANPVDPLQRLFAGQVFHKAFVRVDEKGTEAAAASAMGIPTGAGPGGGPPQVRIDRPFLFLIRDNASGMVLFLGRVTDPGRR
jgi:serine protease inhibitor